MATIEEAILAAVILIGVMLLIGSVQFTIGHRSIVRRLERLIELLERKE